MIMPDVVPIYADAQVLVERASDRRGRRGIRKIDGLEKRRGRRAAVTCARRREGFDIDPRDQFKAGATR